MRISVFGSGSWGTAIAILLCGNGHEVTLWSAFESEAKTLDKTRENPFLKGVTIPAGIRLTADIKAAAAGCELAVLATPSFAVAETAAKMNQVLERDTIVVCISKGVSADGTLFSEILRREFGEARRLVTLSGPTHAEEVSRRIPTACVAASENLIAATIVQDAFMNGDFRVYTSADVTGVELGAAMKNIIALCAGACDGLGFGDNTIAMLATRGLTEIAALVAAAGGKRETVSGLAGLGDLIVTCTSKHSRNRRAGVLIGQGKTPKEAMDEVGAVVEGYYAAAAAKKLIESLGVEMPICSEAYRVLYEGKDVRVALRELMTREKRSEG